MIIPSFFALRPKHDEAEPSCVFWPRGGKTRGAHHRGVNFVENYEVQYRAFIAREGDKRLFFARCQNFDPAEKSFDTCGQKTAKLSPDLRAQNERYDGLSDFQNIMMKKLKNKNKKRNNNNDFY